jgi:hypothetical protein
VLRTSDLRLQIRLSSPAGFSTSNDKSELDFYVCSKTFPEESDTRIRRANFFRSEEVVAGAATISTEGTARYVTRTNQ